MNPPPNLPIRFPFLFSFYLYINPRIIKPPIPALHCTALHSTMTMKMKMKMKLKATMTDVAACRNTREGSGNLTAKVLITTKLASWHTSFPQLSLPTAKLTLTLPRTICRRKRRYLYTLLTHSLTYTAEIKSPSSFSHSCPRRLAITHHSLFAPPLTLCCPLGTTSRSFNTFAPRLNGGGVSLCFCCCCCNGQGTLIMRSCSRAFGFVGLCSGSRWMGAVF
jgi:hypothetical protein